MHVLDMLITHLHSAQAPLVPCPYSVALGSWGSALLFFVSAAHAGQLQAQTLYSF